MNTAYILISFLQRIPKTWVCFRVQKNTETRSFSSGCSEKKGSDGACRWRLDLAAQQPQSSFMRDGGLRTPLRSGKGLELRRAEEEEESPPTPLLVCRFERRPQFGMAVEVEAAAAEEGVTPGGDSTAVFGPENSTKYGCPKVP